MSTTAVSASPTGGPSGWSLVRARTRSQITETIRTPVAVVLGTVFPTLSFVFFVLPQSTVTDSTEFSLAAVGQLSVFAVMSTFLFTYGAGIAEERKNPWTTYLRTLPSGAFPSTVARAVTASLFIIASIVPLVVVAAVFTAAPSAFGAGGLALWRVPAAVLALLVPGLPFLGIGLTVGYLTSAKAAIAVAQVLLLPMAFLGGLFLPPSLFPGWLNVISQLTPARAGRDFVVQILTGADAPWSTVPVLVFWSVLMGALAVWAYRRDEGQRYR